MYKTILNKKLSSVGNKDCLSKLKIYHDFSWYQKQKKYIEGYEIIPITFSSNIDENSKKTEKIMRNGLLYLKDEAKATILVCHGFMSSKEDVAFVRYIFRDYNVLTFDFRAHGECIDNQFCTFGHQEKNDVIGAVNFIKDHPKLKNLPVLVYAFSMGAVASIIASGENNKLFDAAIWDCPFDSTNGLITRAMNKMKINLFGFDFYFPGSFLLKKYVYNPYMQNFLKIMLKFIAKMDATQIETIIQPVTPSEKIKDIKIPFFLITCHNDEKVPPSAVIEIYKNAINSPYKRLWISSGRRHFDAFFSNPEKYIYKIRRFFDSILNKKYLEKSKDKIKEDPCIYSYF